MAVATTASSCTGHEAPPTETHEVQSTAPTAVTTSATSQIQTGTIPQVTIALATGIQCAVNERIVVCTGTQPFTARRSGDAAMQTQLAVLGIYEPTYVLAGDQVAMKDIRPGDLIENWLSGTSRLLVAVAPARLQPDFDLKVVNDCGRIETIKGSIAALRLPVGHPVSDLATINDPHDVLRGWKFTASEDGAVVISSATSWRTDRQTLTISPHR
ncbi:hypothetical protein UI24_06905 [Mycobacteroides franklinii]|nr:hypothetical protein [Mycobacteroides franklinii]